MDVDRLIDTTPAVEPASDVRGVGNGAATRGVDIAANPAWMGSLEPCSPLRAYDKCLWWFGGGDSGTAVEVRNPWRIVEELGLACP